KIPVSVVRFRPWAPLPNTKKPAFELAFLLSAIHRGRPMVAWAAPFDSAPGHHYRISKSQLSSWLFYCLHITKEHAARHHDQIQKSQHLYWLLKVGSCPLLFLRKPIHAPRIGAGVALLPP